MKGLRRFAVLFVVAGLPAMAFGSGQTQQYYVRSDAVAVPTLVKSGGRPVTDLRIDDFALADSGVPQTITALLGVDAPLDVSIVVQQTIYAQQLEKATFASEIDEVGRLLRPTDRLEVISATDGGRTLLEIGSPTRAVRLPVESNHPCIGIYDAIVRALARPSEPGRRHLLFVLTRSEGGGGAITREVALAVGGRSHTAISVMVVPHSPDRTVWLPWGGHPLCAGATFAWNAQTRNTLNGISRTPDTGDQMRALRTLGRERLDEFAEATGGHRLNPPLVGRSIAGVVVPVIDEARSKYTLYYTPTGVGSAGRHPITVSIRRPGRFDVSARSGYER